MEAGQDWFDRFSVKLLLKYDSLSNYAFRVNPLTHLGIEMIRVVTRLQLCGHLDGLYLAETPSEWLMVEK